MATDDIVLSYHDCLLRSSDVGLLETPNWLNDNIIGFSFEYFSNEEFSDCLFAFISPEVSQLMKASSSEDIEVFLAPLELKTKEAVFIAVNDNTDMLTAGGSHWSLLVFRRHGNRFEHYDSSCGSNNQHARCISRKVAACVGAGCNSEFVEVTEAPQQINSFDCGVYVICFTSYLAKILSGAETLPIKQVINAGYVSKERKKLKDLILKLRKR